MQDSGYIKIYDWGKFDENFRKLNESLDALHAQFKAGFKQTNELIEDCKKELKK